MRPRRAKRIQLGRLNEQVERQLAALIGEEAVGDIDILVKFDGPATSARYFGVQFYLEDLLGQSVDLVTDKALREELRPFIEREAVNV